MKTENTSLSAANYRIYDRTGGGATEDIYAETLEVAIEKGREWIETGDWERDELETPLECCALEIVRVPDLRSITSLPAVYDARVEDGSLYPLHEDMIVANLDAQAKDATASTLGARLSRVSDPDDDGYADYVVTIAGAIPQMIDEDATLAGDPHDCSGVCPAVDAPDCRDGEEHDWQSPYSLVGGIRENPGVWGSGHGRTKCTEVCAHCGLYRTTDHGATLPSNGQRARRISYQAADDKSEANGLPRASANTSRCTMTTTCWGMASLRRPFAGSLIAHPTMRTARPVSGASSARRSPNNS